MAHSYHPKHISIGVLQEILAKYPRHVSENVRELDELRFNGIPKRLKCRKKSGHAYLDINELESLVEWKLTHGTFRPRLLQLAKSNGGQVIKDTTSRCFQQYDDSADLTKALKTLTELKGIGPATASLLLSVYDPDAAPFFSDELYRYVQWEPTKLGGWSRKIGYTAKEYASLNMHVAEMRKRLKVECGEEIPSTDIEQVAYVLGREDQDLAATAVTEGPGSGAQAEEPARAGVRSSRNTGVKRKLDSRAADGEKVKAGAANVDARSSKLRKDEKDEPSRDFPPMPSKEEIDMRMAKFDENEARVQECLKKGPNGSPTYDRLGYELDYDKILAANKPPKRGAAHHKRVEKMMEQEAQERKRKCEIMRADPNRISAFTYMAWEDCISRDLEIPYHKVTMQHFEDWHKRGFTVKPGELETRDLSKEDNERISDLAMGSAFRK